MRRHLQCRAVVRLRREPPADIRARFPHGGYRPLPGHWGGTRPRLPFNPQPKEALLTAFEEVWFEEIHRIHAILLNTEVVRYTRLDGTTMLIESVVIGLIKPERHVQYVNVSGTDDSGKRIEDRFSNGTGAVPDEIIQLVYPYDLMKVIAEAIKVDKEQCASGQLG